MSSNLPIYRNFGNEVVEQLPNFARELDEMYSDISNALNNLVKKNILTGVNPQPDEQRNSFYSIGDVAIRTDNNTAWIMTSRTTPTAVTWTLIT